MKRKRRNHLLYAAAVLCLISVAVMLCVLIFGKREIQAPFVPPSFDKNAVVGVPDVSPSAGYGRIEGGDYAVSLCGKVRVSEDGAEVYLTNPAENRVWIKVRIMDSGRDLLGETGLLRPGEYLRFVPLQAVPAVGAEVILEIMAYEPDSYYSAGAMTLNTVVYE